MCMMKLEIILRKLKKFMEEDKKVISIINIFSINTVMNKGGLKC